jgi:DNA polymerase III subunit delta'
MNFKDIIGHDRQIDILKRALANDALAHAYLFSGEAGIGKRLTAYALAAALNCEAPGPGGGCGACPACRRVAGGIHPDVRVVMPESRDEQLLSTWSSKDIEKASDEIKIDQIRRAQESISLRPSEGRKKVLIVDGAETMNEASQNAFLKTLEEPPGDSLIILITSMPQSLLPTIRSRCQALAFQPLPRHTLAEVIREKRGLSEEDAWFIAALSRGSLGRALAMDVQKEKTEREQFLSLRNGLAGMRDDEVLALAAGIAKDPDGFDRLIDIGIEQLRDLLVFQKTGDARLLVFAGAAESTKGLSGGFVLERTLQDMELFIQCRTLLERRVSPQLVAENLLLKLARS